jgi:hypothetical protein
MSSRFKSVTTENWLDPDPLYEHLVKRDKRDGSIHPIDGRDWIEIVNAVHLDDRVPEDVRDAFWFTVGAVGYSYFYWPLLTLVAQQTLRVADFAVDRLFDTLALQPKPRSFARRLVRLRDLRYLDATGYRRWDALRNLRNESTHPSFQQNWGHSMSLELVRTVADSIKGLPWPI